MRGAPRGGGAPPSRPTPAGTPLPARLQGITFTYPTLGAGYRILVATEDTGTVDYWIFMNAFEWCVLQGCLKGEGQPRSRKHASVCASRLPAPIFERQHTAVPRCRQLWLAILLTAIGVGLILWGVERWANMRPAPPGEPPYPKLQPQVFGALGRPMQVGGCHLPLSTGAAAAGSARCSNEEPLCGCLGSGQMAARCRALLPGSLALCATLAPSCARSPPPPPDL